MMRKDAVEGDATEETTGGAADFRGQDLGHGSEGAEAMMTEEGDETSLLLTD